MYSHHHSPLTPAAVEYIYKRKEKKRHLVSKLAVDCRSVVLHTHKKKKQIFFLKYTSWI